MPIFDCNKVTVEATVRLAWLVTALLLLFFVLVPYVLSSYLTAQGVEQFDSRVNALDILVIAGGLSSLSFFIIAYRFGSIKLLSSASPDRMCAAIKNGLVFALLFWVFFFYLTLTDKDGDGITRGMMCVFYPFILVTMVLRLSRGSK